MLLTHIPSERSPGGPLPRSVARGHGRAFCPAPTRSIAALRPGPATGTCPTACSSLRCRERPEAPLTRPATPGGSARPPPTPAWVPAPLRRCRPLPDEQAHRVPPRLARPPEEPRGVTGTGRDISPAPPDRSGAGPGRLGGAGGGGGGPAPSSAGTPGW